ncbi:MAG: hypothetical protein J1E16_05305 [Muribaculaceae bacterium]|nr:hypothetical protein [Muribaculaceae bacterium]
MKAIYKYFFLSVALAVGMTSCDNKDELPDPGPLDNAEKLVAGTYIGEWTRVIDGTDEVETGKGSITFSVDSENYGNNVSVMTLTAEGIDLGLDDKTTSVCNITILSSGDFTYWNQTASNPFGTTFYGNVSTDGVAKMYYTKSVRDGRKTTTYNYSFSGNKQ